MSSMDFLQFYAKHDALTDPGGFACLYDELPAEPSALCDVISGLIVHTSWATKYGIPPETPMPRETQPVAERLRLTRAVFDGSLLTPRPPGQRTFGTCRDFALLLCSILRHHAVPARVRCGFATYFANRRYTDHWICEYWMADENRWAKADAQLDGFQRADLGIEFDCADLPRGSFLTAGEAWTSARSGAAPPGAFGHGETEGLWFLQVNLHRDLLALANRQMSAWDTWRVAQESARQLSGLDLTAGDRLAENTAAHVASGRIAALSAMSTTCRTPPWMQ